MHDVDFVVAVTVGDEGDVAVVGRPGGLGVFVGVVGEVGDLACGDVEEVDVAVAVLDGLEGEVLAVVGVGGVADGFKVGGGGEGAKLVCFDVPEAKLMACAEAGGADEEVLAVGCPGEGFAACAGFDEAVGSAGEGHDGGHVAGATLEGGAVGVEGELLAVGMPFGYEFVVEAPGRVVE